jgi:subtilisin family serine protease
MLIIQSSYFTFFLEAETPGAPRDLVELPHGKLALLLAVINLSLGGSTTDPSGAVQAAINYAINQKNVVVVAAAGNSGNSFGVSFPASIASVIAVGATNQNNTLASFSCTGSQLDVVAPGVNILGTIPTNTTSWW